MTKTIDEMVTEIETAGLEAVLATLGDEGQAVLSAVAPILEAVPNMGVQTTISAVLVGFAFASIEGEPTQYEQQHATFISAEDRLKLWIACMWAAYKAAMEIRKDPNCPSPTPKGRMM